MQSLATMVVGYGYVNRRRPVAIEPEWLAHLSLGQENPRMWVNAALCEDPVRQETLNGFHEPALCGPFRGTVVPKMLMDALPQADLSGPVRQNRKGIC
jgi:hypothetical protein